MKANVRDGRRAIVAAAIMLNRSERDIAAELKVSPMTVHRDIVAIRLEWQRERLTAADVVAAQDLQRIAALEAVLWEGALAKDYACIDRLFKLWERRARLLGTDAPVKVDVEYRLREMAEAAGLDPDEAVREAQSILAAIN